MSDKDICKELFESALDSFFNTYNSRTFYMERDIVWTIQTLLNSIISNDYKYANYKVYSEYSISKSQKSKIIVDLAILKVSSDKAILIAEFKYEPNHKRGKLGGDIKKNKFPVVSWTNVCADIDRIKDVIINQEANIGYSIFIDEGGAFNSVFAVSKPLSPINAKRSALIPKNANVTWINRKLPYILKAKI